MVKLGDTVIYRCPPHEKSNGAEFIPAIVVRVWSDTCVNLRLIRDGRPEDQEWKTSVGRCPNLGAGQGPSALVPETGEHVAGYWRPR